MKKEFSNTIEVIEGESEIIIVTIENKDKKDYKEINISLDVLLLSQDWDERSIKHLKEEGFFPKKEILFKTWIHPDLFEGLKENDGLEYRDLPCLN